MKTFIAVLLLGACATYAFAEELQMPFNKAVFQFLDERHDERMAQVLRDNGLPEDTLPAADERADSPAFLAPCITTGKLCWKLAGRDPCKKLECIDCFLRCAVANHPTPLPKLTIRQKGCLALLYLCRKHSPSCAGELCCFVRIKRCFKASGH
ncbi:uncharacterized protein [Porites lutea]|uniref:uncharacterized protein n=1 Tax=Porites lutea TaxID=51062 RepID=UPI003CC64C4E